MIVCERGVCHWVCAVCLSGPPPPGCPGSVPQSREGVEGWTHVKVDGSRVIGCRLTAIVVNDVADPSSTPIHDPVMAVKRQLIPTQSQKHN